MVSKSVRGGFKQFLRSYLFLFLCIGTSVSYGIERGPIFRSDSPPQYLEDPQSSCERVIESRRGTPWYPVPGPNDADVLSIWTVPYYTSSGLTFAYSCAAKILRFTQPPQTFDVTNAGWVYPVCNNGDSAGGTNNSSDMICNIPDSTTDQGANQGEQCPMDGNPVNPGTGNKFAEEIDITLPGGLSFSRYYNSDSLSGSTQIGLSWRHTYQRSLVINAETVTASRTDGKLVYFRLVGSDWTNQIQNSENLTPVDDGNGNIIGWQLTSTDNTVENYDTAGKLLSLSSRDGRTQTLTYDTYNKLATVTDDVGRTLNFTYDGSGRIATLNDPAGGVFTYGYDTDSNLVSVTYPDNKTRTYHYNEQAYTNNTDLPHALTGITDEKGIRYATYTYDSTGRAIVTEHAGGADRHALNYVSTSSTEVTDPLNSVYTRNFQTILGVAKSTGQSQPAGSGCSAASSATTFDVNGNVASRADFNGNKTCYAYDLTRNLEIARVEGLASSSSCPADVVNYTPAPSTDERKILTGWHASFRLPVSVTEAGRVTTIAYDTYGNVTQLSIQDTASSETRTWSTSYTYHATVPGVIVQRVEDGPRTDVSDTTTIDYYAPDAACTGGHFGCRGQVMRITNALGHITDITRYNAHGQPEQIVDANNLTTTLTYDSRQRLVSRVVGTETTTYQYDGVGQLIQLTRPDGSSLTYTYDDAHRLTDITDSLGNAIRYTLDAAGNRTKVDIYDAGSALAQTRQQEFDALSRLWKITGAQSQVTELAYDANGNLKQTTDPLLHTATRQFDALDRLIQANDPMSGQTLQSHDALDQVTQVTDPKGVATSYTTNAFGDVTQEVSQDRGTTNYTYDLAGNQLTKTDARGVVQTTAYDALNRPISQSYTTVTGVPQTGTITWTYDTGTNGVGHLTQMSDESGSTSYQYDAHGRITNKTQTVSYNSENFVQTLSYQYNANGQLTSMTYPSGAQITYTYGTDGRPTELRVNGAVLMQNIVYRPFGEPESWSWGNSQVYSRSFDLDGRLTQHPLGSETQALTYDAASRIINTTNTNTVYNRTYEYDANDRLIRQTDNTTTKLWGYDANSNRTSEQSGATVYPYTVDANSNRLLSVAGPVAKTYTYDAAGNPQGDGTTTFTWNAAGRLVQTTISGNTYQYQHNGSGERVKKGLGSNSHTFFMFGPGGQLIGDYLENQATPQTGDWLLQQETVWLGNIPVAVLKQASPTDPMVFYMIHADHLNTPRVITNATGTPIWTWRNLNAFGDNTPNEDPDGDSNLFTYNLRFAGQYFDTETNLHYNYFRDYEPATGRYLSSDPIGLAGGLNIYGYVLQNPLAYIDPTGLIVWPYTDEHRQRNRNNQCPSKPPKEKICESRSEGYFDEQGNQWYPDDPRAASIFHGGNNGFRSRDGSGGGSQCFYDPNTGDPIFSGDDKGTYDYSNPEESGKLDHFWDDVFPHIFDGNYETPDRTFWY